MAKIDKSVLGHVTGKLGDLVFRNIDGRKFASLRPSKYKASQSDKAKTGRANFAVAILFAKKINSTPRLKEIWTDAVVPGKKSFNRIFKANAKRVSDGSLTASNIITPSGFPLPVSEAVIENGTLHLTFSLTEDSDLTFPLELFLFFYFNKEFILSQLMIIGTPAPGNQYTLNINLNQDIKNAFAANPHPVIYAALSGVPVNKNKIYWTSTSAKQL